MKTSAPRCGHTMSWRRTTHARLQPHEIGWLLVETSAGVPIQVPVGYPQGPHVCVVTSRLLLTAMVPRAWSCNEPCTRSQLLSYRSFSAGTVPADRRRLSKPTCPTHPQSLLRQGIDCKLLRTPGLRIRYRRWQTPWADRQWSPLGGRVVRGYGINRSGSPSCQGVGKAS